MVQQRTVSEQTLTWRPGREERLRRGMTKFGHPAQVTVGGADSASLCVSEPGSSEVFTR